MDAAGGRDGRHHIVGLDPDVPRRLVGEQRDELGDQVAKGGGVGVDVAQQRDLVCDQRVIDIDEFHGVSFPHALRA